MADRGVRRLQQEEEEEEEEMEAEAGDDMDRREEEEAVRPEEGQVEPLPPVQAVVAFDLFDGHDQDDDEMVLMEEEVEVEEGDDSWPEEESGEESEGAESSGEEDTSVQYDKTLPSRHVYLGETEELRGRTVQEENDYVTIPLLFSRSLMNLVLVPTQTLPLNIVHPMEISMLRTIITKDRTFGIVASKTSESGSSEMAKYGTTAEIYEYQEEDLTGALTIKAKGRQRFKVMSTHHETTGLTVARVQILPEIRMGNPFEMMRLHSLDKLTLPNPQEAECHIAKSRELASVRTANSWRVRERNAWLTPWPPWIYNQYDDLLLAQRVVNEIKNSTMIKPNLQKLPCDPQDLSHWAAINLPLDDTHRLTLLSLNTPTQRLQYILSVLPKCKILICVQCSRVIGDTADIFSMSVEGPQGTFVNPGGYVHEMLTLNKVSSLSYFGRPSIEHSWFPGYAWTIANCVHCHSHMGWKFTAIKRKLKPQKFYGVTRKAVRAQLVLDGDEREMRLMM